MDARFAPQQAHHAGLAWGRTPPLVPRDPWFTSAPHDAAARVQLFCLPFAGGGASIYRTWGAELAPSVAMCPIQLPGREERLAERPYTDLRTLAEHLAERLRPYTHRPFALFGHSMGALLAFEVARSLRRQASPRPVMLFLSAHRAAHLPLRRQPFVHLPTPAFLQGVRALGGTPSAVFEHPDLLALTLPALRADFTACDTYCFVPEAPLDCPLMLYAGCQDTEATPEEVAAWSVHTTQSASLRVFPGQHFFLRSDRDQLLRVTATALASLVVA
jgi:medium-chain acyl-[acyl-carrier-protein] hydrolase